VAPPGRERLLRRVGRHFSFLLLDAVLARPRLAVALDDLLLFKALETLASGDRCA
jgi:hypothetical protein